MQAENTVRPGVRGMSFIWFCFIQNATLLQYSTYVDILSDFEEVFGRDAFKKWDKHLLTSTEKKQQHSTTFQHKQQV